MPSRSFSFTGVPSSPVADTAETLLFRGGIVGLVYSKVGCMSGLESGGTMEEENEVAGVWQWTSVSIEASTF